MFDIGVCAYLRVLFFENSEEFGKKGILGQPPSIPQDLGNTKNSAFFRLLGGTTILSSGFDALASGTGRFAAEANTCAPGSSS